MLHGGRNLKDALAEIPIDHSGRLQDELDLYKRALKVAGEYAHVRCHHDVREYNKNAEHFEQYFLRQANEQR